MGFLSLVPDTGFDDDPRLRLQQGLEPHGNR